MKTIVPKLIVLLLVLSSTACTTYRTNSKEVKFDSARAENIKPEIYVGELNEKAEDFTYLGWVDAKVSKPNVFADSPTEHMADIVLANKARKMGAHAVTFVSYKVSVTGAMTAKGQAVRINAIDDKEILQEQKASKIKKQQQMKELIYGSAEAAAGHEDIPVTSTTTGTVLPDAFTDGEEKPEQGSVEDIKQNLVVHSATIEETAIAQNDIELMLRKLKQLRKRAGDDKDFELYQGITEVIEMLREYEQ